MVSIEGSGAYCSGMSTKNYNSFPEVAEVILAVTGESHVIRKWVTRTELVLSCYLIVFYKFLQRHCEEAMKCLSLPWDILICYYFQL